MIPLGDKRVDSTVYCYFDTYNSDMASVTITGLAVTDIEIYKDGGTTQRASDNGYALLDTDGIDFDGATGLHGFSVDLSDNSDAGFYAAGSHYLINVNAITVNAQTVRLSFGFTLGDLLRPATAGRTLGVESDGDLTKVDTLDGHTAQTGDSFARIGANGASLTALPWNAAWDAEVQSECADALTAYDPPTKAEMDTGHGLLATEAKQDVIDGIVDDILVDTAVIGALGAGLTALPWNAAWDAEVQSECADALAAYDPPTKAEMDAGHGLLATEAKQDVIDGIVDAILADTGTTLPALLPAALVGGKMDSNIGAINAVAAAAVRLGLSAGQIIPGTVDNDVAPSTTIFEADDITEATADHFNGRNILFTSGNLAGQMTDITDYALNGANGQFTVTAMTEAPANDDTFVII